MHPRQVMDLLMQYLKCIKKLYPHDVNLQLYQVHAVTEGTDAQATVSVRIEEEWKNYCWTGS